MRLLTALKSLMEKINHEVQMLYLVFSQMPWLLVLTIGLAMITFLTLMSGLNSTTK